MVTSRIMARLISIGLNCAPRIVGAVCKRFNCLGEVLNLPGRRPARWKRVRHPDDRHIGEHRSCVRDGSYGREDRPGR